MSNDTSSETFIIDPVLQYIEICSIVAAIVLIVLLTVLEGRQKGEWRGICMPIDFMKYDHLTFVYAAAFGISSSDFVALIFERSSMNAQMYSRTNMHRFIKPFFTVLFLLLIVLVVTIKFYPMFAVIRSKRIIVHPLIGFVYTGFLFSAFIYQIVLVIQVCGSKHQRMYVQWLLTKPPECPKKTTDSRISKLYLSLRKRISRWLCLDSPIRGSPRVICTFVVSGIVLFQVGGELLTSYVSSQPSQMYSMYFGIVLQNTTLESFIPMVQMFFVVTDVGFYISFTLSSIVIMLYIGVIYSNYRKDLEKMHRGDYSFIPVNMRKTDDESLITASLRYAGLQIAYLAWCYVMAIIVIWILCYAFAYIIVLPLTGDVPFLLFEPVLLYIPMIVFGFLVKRVQVYLSKRFFLQEKSSAKHIDSIDSMGQRMLALDNRKSYNVVTFFSFFFNAIIGLISALNRIFIGLIIGLVSMARTDICMLPVGFESFDIGYSTYIGMILVELHHRNPIVAVFCDNLSLCIDKPSNVLEIPLVENQKHIEQTDKRRIRRRWQKAFTLLNNPSIRKFSKSNLQTSNSDKEDIDTC